MEKNCCGKDGNPHYINFTHIKVNPRMTSTPGFEHGPLLHHHCPYEKGILLFSRPTTWRYSGGFKEEARSARPKARKRREKKEKLSPVDRPLFPLVRFKPSSGESLFLLADSSHIMPGTSCHNQNDQGRLFHLTFQSRKQ